MRRPFPTLLVLLAISCPFTGRAAPGSRFTVARAPLEQILTGIAAGGDPLSCLEGEVVAAGRNCCRLRGRGSECSFSLRPGCVVFANGLPACLETIRPVAPGASFWARLWLDQDGGLRLIEAVYAGGELIVTAQGDGVLTGLSPENQTTVILAVADSCCLGQLSPGRLVYVLLDLEGRIRWVCDLGAWPKDWQS